MGLYSTYLSVNDLFHFAYEVYCVYSFILACFELLAIVNIAAMITHVQIFIQDPAFNIFGIHLEVSLQDHVVILFFLSS